MPQISKPVVIIESPYAGDIEKNLRYVRACLRDSILRGECPLASHALYTQPGVLRDEVHEERELGMGLGWHVMKRADLVAIYTDLGWSSGMVRGYNAASSEETQRITIRRLGGEWSKFEHGVDYGAVGATEDAHVYFVMFNGERYTDQMFIEVDCKQGYGVAYKKPVDDPAGLQVEVIKGNFELKKIRFEMNRNS